ncbi:amidohydrolase family protein [Actinomycetospora endophytica]|uniref:Amidohydrolase family protein n=1 Tax=Actinomycetospora endophytica TaxID=2291215 RepID=A0ABS8PD46_9PSEU|nr:amidohydrolase family protein [Actinomycetospora endophytica]MCD2195326.1 amidohydrolase family protein [Actinomycetospora endophytica]
MSAPDSDHGPVIDAFLHTPWLGGDDPADPRGDRVDWTGDARLARVMHTFRHDEAALLSADDLLAAMDDAGTTKALLPAKVYYRATEDGVRAVHREIGALTRASGGRLKGVATIPPPELGPGTYWDVMATVRVLRDAYAEHGVVGVHLTPAPWGMPPDHAWFWPVLATCSELGLAVFVHVGMPGPLWPAEHQDPVHLDRIALAFPDLVIVAHHIGDPWTETAVRLAARHPNLYLCTSAWAPSRYPTPLVGFLRGGWHGTVGAEKVLFATDHPLLDIGRATASARALGLDEERSRAFLHDNARRLFWPEEES